MIQQEYKNNVEEVNGDIKTTGFSIEVNESMFQMLTSNVYNDPMLAVMREWSTNACDACIAGNVDVNFDVHLPTVAEPTFYVRDYGTGLAPEDIVGLFSNLGASTKRGSNAYNGTFGIGRMAGLAVSEAFTVDSYYNGTLHSYVITMQNGVPVTMHLGDSPTTEPNGLKLAIAVDPNDISSYLSRAQRLYKFFDHKPNLNRDDVNIHLDVKEHISDKWFIMKMEGRSHRDNNWVVMSQVAYEIPNNNQVDTQGFQNLVIKVPPGSVSFNPGRETLSLNKNTITFINDAFKRIKDEYIQAATAKLASAKNDAELMNIYSSVSSAAPYKIVELIDPSIFASQEYKNLFNTRYQYYNKNAPMEYKYLGMSQLFQIATKNKISLAYKSSYYKTAKPMNYENTISWQDFFYSSHVIIDVKTKFRAALNEHYNQVSLVTWQREGTEDIDEAVQIAKDYLSKLGIPYTLASSIIKDEEFSDKIKAIAPREGFYASTVSGVNVFKSEKMDSTDVETNQYLYLKLKHSTPIIEDPSFTFEEYQEAYNLLNINGDMPEVKGVAKKYQDFVEQLDNWVDYETFIKQKMKESTFRVPYETPVPRLWRNIINNETYTNFPKPLQEYYLELRDYHQFNSGKSFLETEHLRELAKKFNANFVQYEPQRDVDLEYLEKVYPVTYKILSRTAPEDYYDTKASLLWYLAKLEEEHALHSSIK